MPVAIVASWHQSVTVTITKCNSCSVTVELSHRHSTLRLRSVECLRKVESSNARARRLGEIGTQALFCAHRKALIRTWKLASLGPGTSEADLALT